MLLSHWPIPPRRPIVSATRARVIDHKLALDPRPSPLPLRGNEIPLSKRKREREDPEIGEIVATSGRRGSILVATKSILSISAYTDCYAIEKQSRDRQGSSDDDEDEETCVVLPSSINQGKWRGVQWGGESPSSCSACSRRGRRARRKFTRPISITIEGTEHYRF